MLLMFLLQVISGSSEAGRTDVSLHCTKNGNYERLQCDNDRCWCVEELTGRARSMAVPASLWEWLPCFTRNDRHPATEVYGGQYLRRCESRVVGIQKVKEWFR